MSCPVHTQTQTLVIAFYITIATRPNKNLKPNADLNVFKNVYKNENLLV